MAKKFKPIIELHGGFTSWCLLPTILCGTWANGRERGGWAYFYWIKGTLGVKWSEPRRVVMCEERETFCARAECWERDTCIVRERNAQGKPHG